MKASYYNVVKNSNTGIAFTIRLVMKGESYGRKFCLINEKDEPLVELYDTRFPHTEYGQFVSRYNLSTFMKNDTGLWLDGGIPEWTLNGYQVTIMQQWLRGILRMHKYNLDELMMERENDFF